MAYNYKQSTELYRFNVPLFIISMVALIVIAVGCFFLHRAQMGNVRQALYDRAHRLADEEEYVDAADYLGRYLRLAPDDVEAHIDLAKWVDESDTTGRNRAAVTELYYKAINYVEAEDYQHDDKNSLRVELRTRLCELLLARGDFDDLAKEAKALESLIPDDLLTARFRAIAEAGRLAEQERLTTFLGFEGEEQDRPGELLHAIFERDPSDAVVANQLARLFRNNRRLHWFSDDRQREFASESARIERADQIIDEMVSVSEAGEEKARANLVALAYAMDFDLDSMITIYLDGALLEGAELPEVQHAAGVIALDLARKSAGDVRLGHLSQAEECFQFVVETEDSMAAGFLGQGDVEFERGNFEAAAALYERALLREDAVGAVTEVRLVEALLRTEDPEVHRERIDEMLREANQQAQRIVDVNEAQNQVANTFLASVYYLQGLTHLINEEFHEALPLFLAFKNDTTVSEEIRFRGFVALGQTYDALERWDMAAQSYSDALDLREDNQLVIGYVIRAAANAEDFALAAEMTDRLADQTGTAADSYSSTLALFRQLNKAGASIPDIDDLDRSLSRLDSLLNDPNDRSMPAEDRWLVELLRLDIMRLKRIYDPTAPGALPNDFIVEFLSDLLADEDYQESSDLKRRCALIFASIDENDKVDELLNQIGSDNDLAEWEVLRLRGEILLGEEAYEMARQAFREGVDAASDDEDKFDLELLFTKGLFLDGKTDEASDHLVSLASQYPSKQRSIGTSLFNMVFAYDLDQVDSKAREIIEEVDGSNGPMVKYLDGRSIVYALGRESVQQRREGLIQQAIQHQSHLLELRPFWPPTLYLAGLVAEAQGLRRDAVTHYRNSISVGDSRPTILIRTIDLLIALNETREAERILDVFGSDIPFSDTLLSAKLGLASLNNDLDGAEQIARQAVALRERDYVSLIRLGQILYARNKSDEAEQCFREANTSNQSVLVTWNWLIDFLINTDQREKAETTLQEFSTFAENGNHEFPPFDIAALMARSYVSLDNRPRAIQYFERAKAINGRDITIAREMAAYVSTYDHQEAEQLCEQILRIERNDVETIRLLAGILAKKDDEASWNRAIRILQEVGATEESRRVNARLTILLLIKRGLVDIANQKDHLDRADQLLTNLMARDTLPATSDVLLDISIKSKQAESSLEPRLRISLIDETLDGYKQILIRDEIRDIDVYNYLDLLFERHRLAVDISDIPITAVTSTWLQEANGLLSRIEQDTGLQTSTQEKRLEYIRMTSESEEAAHELMISYIRSSLIVRRQDANSDTDRALAHEGAYAMFRQIGEFGLAEEQAKLAYEIDSNQFDRYIFAVANNGRIEEAVRMGLDKIQEEPETEVRMIVALAGIVSTHALQPSEATLVNATLQNGRTKYDENVDVLSAIGTAYVALNRVDDAIDAYERAHTLAPDDVVILNNLATVLCEQQGRASRARDLIHQAIQAIGDDPALLDTQGMVYYHLEEFEDSRDVLIQAARKSTADARVHFHLAMAYWKLNQRNEALAAYSRAIEENLFDLLLTESDRTALSEMQLDEDFSAVSAGSAADGP